MASKAATHYLQFDFQWASIALIWYDYALTFPLEVQYLWTSKFRLSTFLYILCRYALLANVLYLVNIAGKLTANCNTWYQFIGALSVLGRAAVIVVFTGRTWAVWGKNRFILVYMSILDSCSWASVHRWLKYPHVTNDLLSILMVIFEYSSAILNSIRCIQAFKAHGKSLKEQKEGFQFLLFEQGIFYFGIVSLFTTAAVILNFQAPSGFFQRLLNALTLPLSGLLTARLLLHMREWEFEHSTAAMESVHGAHHGGQGHSNTNFSFRAASVALSTVMTSDFGSDPVARGPNLKNARGESRTPWTDNSTPTYTRPDIESRSNPDLRITESGASAESVKEGKKRADLKK
ncbi:hypothetical protein J3R30DRAFT_1225101 [Lentinula aciculospora]|uniref:DUF6533 domain-containing protein n=1 Tax=Lentinula aciculospora TaxID=153920 RepID=A0A9W8ZZJ3_9AGAR|nr:hypothetical protein J3R30DRAFT_1225101 [Lentinula aciculospora]